MNEDQEGYVKDALEMMGAGYASIEVEQARTVIERRSGKMQETDRPAFVKISTAFKQELPNISGDALKVFLYIALSINRRTSKANPGLRTIAAGVGMAINTLQKVLKELEDLELLTVDRESRRYNIYETPEYISANKAEPTVSNLDTDAQTVSNSTQTVSNSEQSVSSTRGDFLLNQINQKNQNTEHFFTPEEQAQVNSKVDYMIGIAQQADVLLTACQTFEIALFGSPVNWPWSSNAKWQKFAKWCAEQELSKFTEYATWRKGDGKFHAMSNNKIRQDPQMFMDTGWPTFLAHSSMYGSGNRDKGFAL